MINNYLDNLDIYEVEKEFFNSYSWRCQKRELMKLTPRKGLTIWQDIETKNYLYGVEEEIVMEMPAHRFFIFEMLDEELLGPEKTTQHIEVDEETFIKFLENITGSKVTK